MKTQKKTNIRRIKLPPAKKPRPVTGPERMNRVFGDLANWAAASVKVKRCMNSQ